MGGNAILSSIRLNLNEYFELYNKMLEQLSVLDGYTFHLVEAYRSKPSFGDIDILVYADNYDPYAISSSVGATEVIRNSECTSMAIPTKNGPFQADFIYCKKEELNFSKRYFSNNDLGNLIGKISRRLGFKLGHDGLWFILRDDQNDKVIEEILVTLDWDEMLSFFEYPKGYFIANELEDIYKYAVSTPYFTSEPYQFENVNHASRVRDRKRSTYNGFLKWLKETDYPIKEFDYTNKDHIRKEYLNKSFIKFPLFKERLDNANKKYNDFKMHKLKFNGDRVKEMTGLEHKQLGLFIAYFKNKILFNRVDKDFVNAINSIDQTEIDNSIMEMFKEFKENNDLVSRLNKG